MLSYQALVNQKHTSEGMQIPSTRFQTRTVIAVLQAARHGNMGSAIQQWR